MVHIGIRKALESSSTFNKELVYLFAERMCDLAERSTSPRKFIHRRPTLCSCTIRVYQDAGFLKAFGSIDIDVVPTSSPGVMPETKLKELTGMNLKNLSPSRSTGTWAITVSSRLVHHKVERCPSSLPETSATLRSMSGSCHTPLRNNP